MKCLPVQYSWDPDQRLGANTWPHPLQNSEQNHLSTVGLGLHSLGLFVATRLTTFLDSF